MHVLSVMITRSVSTLQGFTGEFCQFSSLYCASSPCLHGGECEPTETGFHCYCPSGLGGLTCEQDIRNECDARPCQHNGHCMDRPGTYTESTCLMCQSRDICILALLIC